MSTRLNVGIRHSMTEAMVKRALGPKAEKIIQQGKEVADRVYGRLYSTKVQEQMYALPRGWLMEASHLAVQFGTEHEWVYFSPRPLIVFVDGRKIRLTTAGDDVERRIQYHSKGTALALEAADPLCLALQEYFGAREDIEKEAKTLGGKTLLALSQFTTVGALLKAWPEVRPFAAKYLAIASSTNLPAVQVSELNRLLALPVKEKELENA